MKSLGILDSVHIAFMVPGHTKLALDKGSRDISEVFNRFRVFNTAMLGQCAGNLSSGQVYD